METKVPPNLAVLSGRMQAFALMSPTETIVRRDPGAAAGLPASLQESSMTRVEAYPDREQGVASPALAALSLQIVVLAGLLQLLLPIRIMSDISVIGHVDPDWLMIAGFLIAVVGLS